MTDGGVVEGPRNGLAQLVERRAASSPGGVFVLGARGDRIVTFAALAAAAQRWRGVLDGLGLPAGSTVGLAIADPVDFALVFLATVAAGRTAAPLDARATADEFAGSFARVAPRVIVADREAPGGLGADAPGWAVMPPGGFELATPAVDALRRGVVAGAPEPDRTGCGERAGGVVLATSGTTGRAKVVWLDEGRLLHTAAAVARAHGLSPSDRGFNPLPLFHINAEVVGVLATLVAGASLVLDEGFHRTAFWSLMARHRVTWINAVPAVLARLTTLEEGEAVPAGIRFARSASAPLPVPVLEQFEAATGVPVVETYGMTEAASQITANPLYGVRKPGSVGVPVASEVRVVGDESAAGRVLVRGPGVIAGYASHGHDDRVSPEGWLETGDLGYLDEDGYLYLVGRADDVINRGGEKVHPKEIEDVVLAEQGVAAAVVVGWAHVALGHVPVAYLVPEHAGTLCHEEIECLVDRVRDRCMRTLSRAKRPAAYHVVASIPLGATGKVRRRAVAVCTPVYSLLVQ